ncbi:hypothetical protein M9458_038844, partial [Cirrhinus mrigala]
CPAGILAVAQRSGPSKPNLPLPQISGLGGPQALHFQGANDEELSYETSPYIKALIDGCS